jgi:hypothetical protein
MFLWLSVATEIVLTAGIHHLCFLTQVLLKTNPECGTTEPVKLFLAHAMLFVGSIWKSKSG